MSTLGDRIKVSTSTTGTGTITLGSPEDGFYDFSEGGISDGDTVRYAASGTTLTRNAEQTLVSGTAGTTSEITLSGTSTVFITAATRNFSYQTAMTLIYGV